MGHEYLGEFEHLVLLAVMRLRTDAYGAPIRRLITERAQREVSFGAVYSTLRRLNAKGYIEFREQRPEGAGGGRPRRVAVLTGDGEAAVRAAQQRIRRPRSVVVHLKASRSVRSDAGYGLDKGMQQAHRRGGPVDTSCLQ